MQTVRGMRDLLPELASKKLYIIEVCRTIFEKYGFEPVETPVLEDFNLLAKKGSGENIKDEIYCFKDKGDREVGLRFDLTVPLARIVASNPQLQKPFKRYQIGNVYRYDRPGLMRYREFTQADADIIGSKSIIAEFECIAIIQEVMEKLKIKYKIKINDRKLLEKIAKENNVKEDEINECLRSLDKLDKIGREKVKEELKNKNICYEIVNVLEKSFENYKNYEEAKRINDLIELLKYNNLDKNIFVDLSLARGLEYYTGIVFEVVANEGPSIAGGGRYDNLIGLYCNKEYPAVGFSFGIDRILDLISKNIEYKPTTKVLVVAIGNTTKEALELTQKIRKENIACEIDLMERNITKNLDYANKRKIPFVIILGPDEIKERYLKIKYMKTGKEQKIEIKDMKKLKEILNNF